jgi:hypothetical protein
MVANGRDARRWGAYAALGIALACGASGRGLCDPVDHHASEKPAASQSDGKPSQEPHPGPTAAIHSYAERIATALEAQNRYQQSPTAQEYTRKAAKAAQDAAFWAMWLFVTGVAETAITAVGVYLVYRTLREAKRSADEANRAANAATAALDHAKEAAEKELRAYISVIPGFFRGQEDAGAHCVASPVIKNFGKTPARNMRARLWLCLGDSDRGDETIFDKFKDVIPYTFRTDVGPGQEIAKMIFMLDGISADDVLKLGKRHGKAIYLFGVIDYTDVFGNDRFTKFCYWINWIAGLEVKPDFWVLTGPHNQST